MTFFILILAGALGLFCHWLVKWSRRQTKAGFVEYMKSNRKHSIASVSSTFAAIVTLYSVGDVVLTAQTAANTFLIGYALDSAVNKKPEDK